MIPNFKMGYYHQKDYIRPYQMSDKLNKPIGFEYTSLISPKPYSILPYVVGGFVGSKSQMNHNKHLSYDLSAVIFNLLNPQKTSRRPKQNIFCSKLNYNKYYLKSNYKEEGTVGLELDIVGALSLFEQDMFSFKGYCDKLSERQSKPKFTERNGVTNQITLRTMCTNSVPGRYRQQSESSVESADSESFIVFDDQDCSKKCKRLEVEFKSENNDSDDDDDLGDDDYVEDDDNDGDDESDIANDDECCSCHEYEIYSPVKELAEANKKWLKNYEGVPQESQTPRKVKFSDDVKINRIVAWDYAYRAARPGPWEQMARDRGRFRERILRLSSVICPVLERNHREKIYKDLYS